MESQSTDHEVWGSKKEKLANKKELGCVIACTSHFSPSLKHRDRTRVQMLAKIFPRLKVKCLLFMGPTLGFDTKQRNSFLIKFSVFYN